VFAPSFAMSLFFHILAFYSRVAHDAELWEFGAILLAGFLTLALFTKRV